MCSSQLAAAFATMPLLLDGHENGFACCRRGQRYFFSRQPERGYRVPNRFPLQADGTPSGSAGVIQTLATSSRQIQFGLRYSF